jgi:DNA-binding MarR family transcriptional regulator
MKPEKLLHLDNQLCFPLYAASRMMTKLYQPLLGKLDITYPQYLILLVLWQNDKLTVSEIGNKLMLETNTITPLLKRMEVKNIIKRKHSRSDERSVIIELTSKGNSLKQQALCIPADLLKGISEHFSLKKINHLQADLKTLLEVLS